MSEFKPSPPDYTVSAISKAGGMKGRVGAAWKLPNGQIRINLYPFVLLDARDELVVTLFPNNTRNKPLSDLPEDQPWGD